jgi:hypothetical protein
MRTGTTYDSPYVRPRPQSLPGTIEPHISRSELPTRSSLSPAAHDASLVVAALEDLEAQRAAIAWLLDADLLCLCLV